MKTHKATTALAAALALAVLGMALPNTVTAGKAFASPTHRPKPDSPSKPRHRPPPKTDPIVDPVPIPDPTPQIP